MKTAIVGINWGDEGKGRMVDMLSEKYDIVVRYQGGNNAGHTVVNPRGKFILNLLPSGILRPEIVNVLGNGMVIDLKHLYQEITRLRAQGIVITPENLKISDKATICLPYHIMQDCLEEERLGDKKFGSTRRGISPVYADKYLKKTLRIGDLKYKKDVLNKLKDLIEWKSLMFSGYGSAINYEEIEEWLSMYGDFTLPFITDTGEYLLDADKNGKNIMFEAQLGALRDIDFGIFPFTSSSNTLASYAPIGSGAPSLKLDTIVGIVKAYSSCVGEGWFTSELFEQQAEILRTAGGEFGAATGRPRRVGAFDVLATNYGIEMQGATELAVTKIDVLGCLEKIPVCVSYKYEDRILERFPYPEMLTECKPVIEYLDGWNCNISNCRKLSDLPENARKYIKFLQQKLNAPIKYISVGAERDEYMEI
ncbi:MAG: adenylosuccinate synthase [Clostridia bacterium]